MMWFWLRARRRVTDRMFVSPQNSSAEACLEDDSVGVLTMLGLHVLNLLTITLEIAIEAGFHGQHDKSTRKT